MTAGRPRVLVARPRADAEPLAHRLEALGYDAVLAPVLTIVPIPLPDLGRSAPGLLIATSANVFIQPLPAAWLGAGLYAVGAATAAAARAAGIAAVRVAGDDATALAAAVQREVPPDTRLVLLAGRPRKPELEKELREAGRSLETIECYEARPVAWSDDVLLALRHHPPAAAVHFSRRSAVLTRAALEAAGFAALFATMTHVCLSEDVASAVRPGSTGPLAVATQPRTESLLQALARILPSG